MLPSESRWSPRQYALLISGAYLVVGMAWILLSDPLAQELADTRPEQTVLQTGKGAAYVAVTAVLLAGLVYVTQQRQRSQTEFIEESLNTLTDSFFVVDPDGELLWFNRTALETLGYDEVELRGMHVSELFADDQEARMLSAIRGALAGATDGVEADVVTRTGKRIPHEFRGRRFTDRRGEVIGVVGIARDVSQRREQDRELRVLDQFLRHNIRTSINLVQGNAELLAGESDADRGREATIREECEKLLTQVEKHRKIVSVFTDPPATEELDLSDVVATVVEESRAAYPEATFEVAAPEEVQLRTSTAIGTALRELVDNSIQHTDVAAPHVTMGIRRGETAVTVEIADDGPGMPELERQVLLEEVEIDQLHHGSGLGLWLAFWIVTRADGQFEITDESPGTTIRIHLPA